MPVAWIITDTEGRIRFLSPAACGLLALDEEASHEGRDLPELIGLRDEDDSTAPSALSRLLGAVRMVTQRRTVDQEQNPIARSRYSQSELLAWK